MCCTHKIFFILYLSHSGEIWILQQRRTQRAFKSKPIFPKLNKVDIRYLNREYNEWFLHATFTHALRSPNQVQANEWKRQLTVNWHLTSESSALQHTARAVYTFARACSPCQWMLEVTETYLSTNQCACSDMLWVLRMTKEPGSSSNESWLCPS